METKKQATGAAQAPRSAEAKRQRLLAANRSSYAARRNPLERRAATAAPTAMRPTRSVTMRSAERQEQGTAKPADEKAVAPQAGVFSRRSERCPLRRCGAPQRQAKAPAALWQRRPQRLCREEGTPLERRAATRAAPTAVRPTRSVTMRSAERPGAGEQRSPQMKKQLRRRRKAFFPEG